MQKIYFLVIVLLLFKTVSADNRCYVNAEKGNDSNSGSSWELAFATLNKALEITNAKGMDYKGDIYVARGTYYPTGYEGIDKAFTYDFDSFDFIELPLSEYNYTFLIRNNVRIYGGFSGDDPDETPEDRDIENNRTTLSGNLQQGGITTEDINACHILLLVGKDSMPPIAPHLDGLYIIGGCAQGIYDEIWEDYSPFDYLVIDDQNIEHNYGGGIYAHNASFTLTQATVAGNYAYYNGGGICIVGSSAKISYTTLSGNVSMDGGAIYNEQASLALSNVKIAGNYASGMGGGLYNFDNCTTTIINSIIWGNTISLFNDISTKDVANYPVYNKKRASTVTISNSILEGCSDAKYFCEGSCEGSYIKEGITGTNFDQNPYFVNLVQQIEPTTDGDYSLAAKSPVIFMDGMLFALEEIVEPTVIPDDNGIIYVRKNASGKGNSWDYAHPSLSEVICFNNKQDNPYTIYIAGGTYTPEDFAGKTVTDDNTITERDYTFLIRNNMSIYGGFSGDKEETISERDLVNNRTVLSGKLGDDLFAYHVLIVYGEKNSNLRTCFNGLTIQEGKADGEGDIYLDYPVKFEKQNGAGLYNHNAASHFEQVIFENNHASAYGGAIYNKRNFNDKNLLTLSLRDVSILKNKANKNGGGIWNQDLIAGERVHITGNEADNYGGGILDAGVFYLSHSFITGNKASDGGAVSFNPMSFNSYEYGVFPVMNEVITRANSSQVTWTSDLALSKVDNCVIADNLAATAGGAFFTIPNRMSSTSFKMRFPIIDNSIVWGNVAGGIANSSDEELLAATNSIIYGKCGGKNVYTQDPLFVGAIDLLTTEWNPDAVGDYKLYPTSPAIGLAEGGKTIGDLPVIDLYQASKEGILYVNAEATGDENGKDWENAIPSLADAISYNNKQEIPYTLYVSKGTYYPEKRENLELLFGYSLLDDRDNTFMIINSQPIYGGFKGDDMTETIDQRDLKNNLTILNGKKGTADNVYHVVVAWGISSDERIAPLLDGLTITGGVANNPLPIEDGNKLVQSQGGGILNMYADTKLVRVRFEDNEAGTGGAIFNEISSPRLTNVLISGNRAKYGAGIYNKESSLLLTNVTIADNTATESGGGLFNCESDITVNNTIICNNRKETEEDNVVDFKNSVSTYNSCLLDVDPQFTEGYSLKTTSPAFRKGSVELYTQCGVSLFDINGQPRLSDNEQKISYGALETQGQVIPPVVYHTVTIPEVEGITTNPKPGMHYVEENGHISLYITLDDDFSDSLIEVLVNGEIVTVRVISPGYYLAIIHVGTDNCTITIEGVSRNIATHNTSIGDEEWQIYGTSGNIRIVPPGKAAPVSVYTLSGNLCFSQTIDKAVNIPLPAGIYIVRADGRVRKVIVR